MSTSTSGREPTLGEVVGTEERAREMPVGTVLMRPADDARDARVQVATRFDMVNNDPWQISGRTDELSSYAVVQAAVGGHPWVIASLPGSEPDRLRRGMAHDVALIGVRSSTVALWGAVDGELVRLDLEEPSSFTPGLLDQPRARALMGALLDVARTRLDRIEGAVGDAAGQ